MLFAYACFIEFPFVPFCELFWLFVFLLCYSNHSFPTGDQCSIFFCIAALAFSLPLIWSAFSCYPPVVSLNVAMYRRLVEALFFEDIDNSYGMVFMDLGVECPARCEASLGDGGNFFVMEEGVVFGTEEGDMGFVVEDPGVHLFFVAVDKVGWVADDDVLRGEGG